MTSVARCNQKQEKNMKTLVKIVELDAKKTLFDVSRKNNFYSFETYLLIYLFMKVSGRSCERKI